MKFHIIKNFKLYLLKKLINSMIDVVSMVIRKNYTEIPRGKDPNLDLHLKYTTIKTLFDFDLKRIQEINIEQEKLDEIQLKIENNVVLKIDSIKDKHKQYIDIFKNILSLIPSSKSSDEISLESIKTNNLKIFKLIIVRIELIQQFINEKRYFSDLSAYKLDIKYEQVIKFITLSAPILLLGGIFKQFILSKIYNFELSVVFSFSDYVSSSIDTLIYSLYSVILLVISSFLGYHEETRLDYSQRKYGVSFQKYMLNIITISSLVFTIAFYFIEIKGFYIFLPLSILVLSSLTLPRLTNRFFKNSFQAFAFTFLIVNFFASIFSNTMLNSYNINNKDNEIKYYYSIDGANKEIDDLRLITKGAYYTVFWDYKNIKTILIQSDKINMIIINKNTSTKK